MMFLYLILSLLGGEDTVWRWWSCRNWLRPTAGPVATQTAPFPRQEERGPDLSGGMRTGTNTEGKFQLQAPAPLLGWGALEEEMGPGQDLETVWLRGDGPRESTMGWR